MLLAADSSPGPTSGIALLPPSWNLTQILMIVSEQRGATQTSGMITSLHTQTSSHLLALTSLPSVTHACIHPPQAQVRASFVNFEMKGKPQWPCNSRERSGRAARLTCKLNAASSITRADTCGAADKKIGSLGRAENTAPLAKCAEFIVADANRARALLQTQRHGSSSDVPVSSLNL
ncbi:unnamed protein product [Lampetra planeri]